MGKRSDKLRCCEFSSGGCVPACSPCRRRLPLWKRGRELWSNSCSPVCRRSSCSSPVCSLRREWGWRWVGWLCSISGLKALWVLVVLFSGALVPLNALGSWFTTLKLLVPLTWGIDLLRAALLGGVVNSGALGGLAIQSGLFVCMGAAGFQYGLWRARGRGELGGY
jgi:hypothetical protein